MLFAPRGVPPAGVNSRKKKYPEPTGGNFYSVYTLLFSFVHHLNTDSNYFLGFIQIFCGLGANAMRQITPAPEACDTVHVCFMCGKAASEPRHSRSPLERCIKTCIHHVLQTLPGKTTMSRKLTFQQHMHSAVCCVFRQRVCVPGATWSAAADFEFLSSSTTAFL